MKLTATRFLFLGVVILASVPAIAQNQGNSFSGRVQRVWEDGFRLNTSGRSITVDTYDICGDNTTRSISAGDQVTVSGEFEVGEFDAFSVTKANGKSVCQWLKLLILYKIIEPPEFNWGGSQRTYLDGETIKPLPILVQGAYYYE